MDKELAAIHAKVGMKAGFMGDEEAMDMVDSMAKEDTRLLELLVDSLEKCMKSGDRRQRKAACDSELDHMPVGGDPVVRYSLK